MWHKSGMQIKDCVCTNHSFQFHQSQAMHKDSSQVIHWLLAELLRRCFPSHLE
jgi:hypothetical protein